MLGPSLLPFPQIYSLLILIAGSVVAEQAQKKAVEAGVYVAS